GSTRQKGDLEQMIWNIPEVIMKLSQMFELVPGDLIFTGTPAGVGPVQSGDLLQGCIEAIGELEITFR
ncbi:MAG: fumarylacetoacetate hydrolase family protein, partial [SAR324 cluster bacterium]|nr:fumarylacetoacetate hydrolase family protein [SAR324 cluster bacterium]